MVTLTKLLEIRMVASSFSGLERISLTLSAISGSSNLSKSVSLSEKKASSEPETKADMQRQSIAAKQAMMLEVSGMLNDGEALNTIIKKEDFVPRGDSYYLKVFTALDRMIN